MQPTPQLAMPRQADKEIAAKALIFLGVFLIFHYAYDWLHFPVVALVAATGENFFQHAKAGFFAWSALSLAQMALHRAPAGQRGASMVNRMVAAVALPWVMFLLWYPVPALLGRIPWEWLEIGYAIAITLVLGVCLGALERELDRARISPGMQRLAVTFYALSVVLFIAITLRVPWADFFRG